MCHTYVSVQTMNGSRSMAIPKWSLAMWDCLIKQRQARRIYSAFFLFLLHNILYLWGIIENNNLMNNPMNRIKEVLEERGIKQTWLAERLGKSFCIVNSYVCNRRQPSLEVLFEIAKILNVNPKELIDSDSIISK